MAQRARSVVVGIAAMVATIGSGGSESFSAQGTPPSFAGKQMALRIGWPPGSGNSILGRLMADHLGKHIPGQPKVAPQYMPGAGTFRLGAFMYTLAPRDGTVLGYISQTAPTEELVGNPAAQALIASVAKTPPDVVARAKALFK